MLKDIKNIVIEYVINSIDISVYNENGESIEGAFYGYSGGDSKNQNSRRNKLEERDSILEMCSGRAHYIHEYPIRLYATTMDYSNYFSICNQKLIDDLIDKK